MNIDELVRNSRPRYSEGWADSPAGKQVLESVMRAPDRTPVRSRRSVARWSFAGAGLVGAAAAAALVISMPGTAPDVPSNPVRAESAQGLLLMAADRAEAAPDQGRYWRLKTLMTLPGGHVGGSSGYDLVVDRIQETWDPRDSTGRSWTGHRTVGARPATKADERAWRADGSPSSWNLGPADTPEGNDLVLSTKPDKGVIGPVSGEVTYLEDLGKLSAAEAGKLPDDPKQLRAWVDRQMRDEMGIKPGTPDGDRVAFSTFQRLLLDVPTTSEVRAAAFRGMAAIPGVKNVGKVTDSMGRNGIGIELTQDSYRSRLVIDDSSHTVLAVEEESGPKGAKSGKKVSKKRSTVVLAAEWTNDKPQIPTLP